MGDIMNKNTTHYYVNQWLLDLTSGVISHKETGEKKRLGEYQLKLLDVLVQHAGQILSREELTTLVWERRVVGSNSLPNAIHALRIALEDNGRHQQIIKTIPKKGYVLAEEYCQQITEPDIENNHLDNIVPVPTSLDDNSSLDKVTRSTSEATRSFRISWRSVGCLRQALRHPIALCFLACFLALCVWLGSALSQVGKNAGQLQAEEQQANAYSNIHLYNMVKPKEPTLNEDSLYTKLKSTLYLINQKLQTENVKMSVYYHSLAATLNFTLLLENACQEQQLAMTIYHWRLNKQNLNDLIYRETERKLNEMDICTS